ncbi:MAG: hypothetical protein ACLFTR_03990 [Candidatus Woesearchaeota archaeon]
MAKTNTLDQLKKFAVIVTIGILFAVLAFSMSDLIVESPEYSDFCTDYHKPNLMPSPDEECEDPVEAPREFVEDCREKDGNVRYERDERGCPVDYECDTCSAEYNEAREDYQLISFTIVSLIGLAGIFSGIYKKPKDEVMSWLLSGFIIGGLASIFIGTITFFGSMDRFMRPIVIIAEIVLVVWLTMKIQRSSAKAKSPKK